MSRHHQQQHRLLLMIPLAWVLLAAQPQGHRTPLPLWCQQQQQQQAHHPLASAILSLPPPLLAQQRQWCRSLLLLLLLTLLIRLRHWQQRPLGRVVERQAQVQQQALMSRPPLGLLLLLLLPPSLLCPPLRDPLHQQHQQQLQVAWHHPMCQLQVCWLVGIPPVWFCLCVCTDRMWVTDGVLSHE